MLLKEKLQAIPIVKTTKSLIRVKVEGLNLKRTNSTDLIFLLILPIPAWPLYLVYREKIMFWCKKMNPSIRMPKIEDIRKKIISDYIWIKKVIDSSETQEHLNSCKMLIETWAGISSNSIRDYKCPFFKTKEIRKTIETYTRAKKDLNISVANKRVILGKHPI